jgi:putative aldouronate transport system substrate-binding protein
MAGASVGGAVLAACGSSSDDTTSNAGQTHAQGTAAGSSPASGVKYRAAAYPGAPAAPADPMGASDGGTVPGDPGYSLPLAPSGTSFTIAVYDNYYAAKSFTNGLPVWEEFEKRTGVKINWQVTPSTQYATVMSPRLGSGSGLPDFMAVPTGWDPVRAASQGLAVALNDYITEDNTPNIMRFFKAFPEIQKMLTAPDGKIYALTSVVTDAGYADPLGLIIRQDWLTKLKLSEPTTLDEWHTVLSAFKSGNPNGKNNALPFFAGGQSNGLAVKFFGYAMGLHLIESSGWYADDSGKVVYEYIDERYQQLLVWLAQLYKEKLLAPDYYKSDATGSLQKVTQDLAGATGDFSNRAIQYNKAQAQAGNKEASWVMTKPPTSDLVQEPYYEIYGPISGYFIVTKDCKNPKLLLHWLDYVWASDQGNTLVTYGIEGKTYTVRSDKRLQLTSWVTDNPDGLDPNSAERYYGAEPTMPWIRAAHGPLSEFSWDMTRSDPKWLAISSAMAKYEMPNFPNILASTDETKKLGTIGGDINTYLIEQNVKFILGQEPLTSAGWNKYLSTLKGMGVDTMIQIKQQQWDRYSKS